MKKLIISLSLLFATCLNAEIVKTQNIIDVADHITSKKTLVVFDVDFTLGVPFPHYNQAKRLYLLEKDTVKLLEKIKSADAQACVLTARTFDEHAKTLEQMKSNNLEFANLTPFNYFFVDVESINGLCRVMHSEGVICSGWCPKGIALREVIEQSSYKPDTVIMVDDKLSNIESVEQELKPLGINVIGIHYTRVFGGVEFRSFKSIS